MRRFSHVFRGFLQRRADAERVSQASSRRAHLSRTRKRLSLLSVFTESSDTRVNKPPNSRALPEQARVLQRLVEWIDYQAAEQTVSIAFRADSDRSLAEDWLSLPRRPIHDEERERGSQCQG